MNITINVTNIHRVVTDLSDFYGWSVSTMNGIIKYLHLWCLNGIVVPFNHCGHKLCQRLGGVFLDFLIVFGEIIYHMTPKNRELLNNTFQMMSFFSHRLV